MPTAWASLQLITPQDVAREVTDLAIPLLAADGVTSRDAVKAKIDVAKDELFEMLDARVHDLYATEAGGYYWRGAGYATFNSWLAATGYTYDDLDGWEDRIDNPEALERVMVALTVRAILADGMLRHRATYNENIPLLDAVWPVWNERVKERFEAAVRRLKIDLDAGGTITDDERIRTANNTLWRT